MADYEQMKLDIRLDSERDLKDNITNVVTFAYESRNLEAEMAGREVKTVRNKHEGYGIASEAFSKIQNAEKGIKTGMGTYLAMLQVEGDDAIRICADLYNSALCLAVDAVNMAADMHRILNDLYYGVDHKTPIEKALDENEDGSSEDGFEEAQPTDAEDGNEAVEENTEDNLENGCEGAEDTTEEGEDE